MYKSGRKTKLKILESIKKNLDDYRLEDLRSVKKDLDEYVKMDKDFTKPVMIPQKVKQIVEKYNQMPTKIPRVLVVCHGKNHTFQIEKSLTMNRRASVKPDIVSDLWSKNYMEYIPENFFDKVIMMYCPISNPFSKKNDVIWKNIYRILKPNGELMSNGIVGLHSLHTKGERISKLTKNNMKQKILQEIIRELEKRKFKKVTNRMDKNYNGYVTRAYASK